MRLEELGLRVQAAARRRPQHLVAAEREEVAVQLGDGDTVVRDELRGVHRDDRAHRVGGLDQLAERRDRPQGVGHPGHRQDLGPLVEQGAQFREVELPVVGERDVAEDRAGHLRRELPGDDVRVVLHVGEEDLVAFLEELPPPPLRDEVQRLRRAASEHDRAGVRRAEEASELGPGTLERLRRLLTERVDPAVGVRVVVGVEVGDGLDHLTGLLGRGRRVQVDERMSVDHALEDREVPAYPLDVEIRHPVPVHAFASTPSSMPSSSPMPS